jgi:hypothetical protein
LNAILAASLGFALVSRNSGTEQIFQLLLRRLLCVARIQSCYKSSYNREKVGLLTWFHILDKEKAGQPWHRQLRYVAGSLEQNN